MEDKRTCKRCGDQVDYLSTDNLCDGCVAEQEAAEAERDLRLREYHAEAVKDPGYQEALEAARGPVSASKGMFLEDALRERARQSIAEGEQAVADEVPLTTIEDVVDAAAVSEWKARDAGRPARAAAERQRRPRRRCGHRGTGCESRHHDHRGSPPRHIRLQVPR